MTTHKIYNAIETKQRTPFKKILDRNLKQSTNLEIFFFIFGPTVCGTEQRRIRSQIRQSSSMREKQNAENDRGLDSKWTSCVKSS